MSDTMANRSLSSSEENEKTQHQVGLEKQNTTWDDTIDIDPMLDKRITRKFDTHVVPWLFGLWLLAFIDRSNIGNARIAGKITLAAELKLDGAGYKFNIALARYLPLLVGLWGFISLCTGFVKTYAGLLVCRALLGIAEGGLLGGMVLYLSMFYRRHQLAYRIVLFYCASPLSAAFGGLLATGLAEIETKMYPGWHFIFFVEGAITVLFACIAPWFMPNSPAESKFLTEEEREAAVARMRLDAHGATASDTVDHEKFSWKWFNMALLNVNTAVHSLNFFAMITPIYSFSLFLPTIISALGFKRVEAQLLTVPPNICAAIAVLIAGWASDKKRMRGPFMLFGATWAIIGYVMLISNNHHWVQYAGTFFVGTGAFICPPLVMGWLTNNLAPHYVRATGGGAQLTIANCAAFVATFTYLSKDGPRYITGHAINIGMCCLSIVCTSFMLWYCSNENKKRAAGKRDYRLTGTAADGQLGFKHPSFRYTL